MSRVVVVGAGFGGIAAAARLAKLGHDVTLVERRDRVGGAIGYVERDGYRWDAGPSTTALPAVLRDLFRKSGRPLERELELVPVEPMREHRFPDGTVLALPSGSRGAQLEAVEAALGGGLGRAWVDHVHAFADTWDVLRRSFLERPWDRDHADRAAAALLRTRTSLARRAAGSLPDRRLRDVATLPTRLAGHDPRHVPAWAGMDAYVEQGFGTWTVPGGLGALAAVLAKRLGERRVRLLLRTRVRDLRVDRGRAVGVDTDAGPVDADLVVCAVDPRALPALARGVRRTRPAAPPTVCHLGLAGDVPALPDEVVLHGDPLLVVRTSGTAAEGGAAWTVLARGRVGQAPVSEDLVSELARRGLDVRGRVRTRVDRSPADQVAEVGGSPYGELWRGRATVDRLLARPAYDGLLLAGAHAAVAPTLPFVGLTAAVVAERVGPA